MSFVDITEAIINKDSEAIERILNKSDASIYLQTNGEGENILHIALRYSTSLICKQILTHAKQFDNYAMVLHQSNNDSWTPLHIAAGYSDYDGYDAIRKALGTEIFKASLRPTRHGNYAINFLDNHQNPDQRVRDDLEKNLTYFSAIPNHQSPLDLSLIRDTYIGNNTLYNNLTYGFIAASAARRIITQSPTHPSANNLKIDEYDELVRRCISLRTIYDNKNNQIQNHDPAQDTQLKLANIVQTVKNEKVGGCSEYSYLVIDALLNIGIKFQNIELYKITNGDHVFVVLDRQANSDMNDYLTWGNSAIVIDAWSGDVYPANKIPKKLSAFLCYKMKDARRLNVVVPFDRSYHQLAVKEDLACKFLITDSSSNVSAFTDYEHSLLSDLTNRKPCIDSKANINVMSTDKNNPQSSRFFSKESLKIKQAKLEITSPSFNSK